MISIGNSLSRTIHHLLGLLVYDILPEAQHACIAVHGSVVFRSNCRWLGIIRKCCGVEDEQASVAVSPYVNSALRPQVTDCVEDHNPSHHHLP